MNSYKVFIENEAGSNQKNLYQEKTLEYRKTVTVSREYPYAYGFVLNTTSGDGDNLDCFVLSSRKLTTGSAVEVRILGAIEQLENGEVDHNLLAVPVEEDHEITDEIKNKIKQFLLHVFDHLPQKRVSVGRFLEKEEAEQLISTFRD